MLLAVLLSVLAATLEAQPQQIRYDPNLLLEQVREKLKPTIDRLPRYLCTETIDRTTFDPRTKLGSPSCTEVAKRKMEAGWSLRKLVSDRLRLDVAVSGNHEMYSWAGANRFADQSLADLVHGGVTQTGTFAFVLRIVFGADDAAFTCDGEVVKGGRALVEFSFHVPVENSGYAVSNGTFRATVPYHGTFLVDPGTFDLVSLTLDVDDIPAQLGICEDTTVLDYQPIRLNGAGVVLPDDVHSHLVRPDGIEMENHTVFSGCHEFQAESSFSFDEGPPAEPVALPKREPVKLPAGLPFTMVLAQPIDSATAAAGDPIRATLAAPLRDGQQVLVPRGAVVNARIVRIERRRSSDLTIALRLETIETGGIPQPFYAQFRPTPSRWDLFARPPAELAMLHFEDVSEHYVIHRGLKVEGTTAAAPPR